MDKLTFNPDTDMMFNWRGVLELPSGTAPNNPDEARVVLRNCATEFRASASDSEACAAAADQGQEALETWVRANYKPVGRAANWLSDFF
jgi:hypothetical protein